MLKLAVGNPVKRIFIEDSADLAVLFTSNLCCGAR
jgi:hypothetical protein